MKLSNILLFYVRRRRIPGRLDRGKVQLVKPVSNSMKIEGIKQVLQEHENKLYLQTPFLTKEEEKYNHAIELEYEKVQMEKLKHKHTMIKLKPGLRTVDHLGHLNMNKQWE